MKLKTHINLWNSFSYPYKFFVLLLDHMISRDAIINVICDQIWKNPASTHTISNLRFHQKWITGSIDYQIPLCVLLQRHESGFCGSFS